MEVYRSVDEVPSPGGMMVTLTMGSFDGVHIGHSRILKKVGQHADPGVQLSGLVTFRPHPLTILAPKSAPQLLSTIEEKISLLSGYGLSYLLVMNFDKKLAEMEASDFVENVLIEKLGMKNMVVGYDTRFGKDGRGDVKYLEQSAKSLGFNLEVVSPVSYSRKIVSSTVVRKSLADANIRMAKGMLGRSYCVTGKVVKGRGLGRKLGVRTANIELPEGKLMPQDGIYAVYAWHGDRKIKGAANLGYRPTIKQENPQQTLEVHLLGFDSDIYGETLTIEFQRHIRAEKKFDDVKDLVTQMEKDISVAGNLLK